MVAQHVEIVYSRKSLQNEPHYQFEVHDHFKLNGHTSMIENVTIIFIDKTDFRFSKEREKLWRDKLRTLSPYGLNISITV